MGENKIRAAVVGYGNIGKYTLEALTAAPDFEVAGIVRRNASGKEYINGFPVKNDIQELGHVDVAILAVPSRSVEEYAEKILKLGINTVDSFDIHTSILDLRNKLNVTANQNNAVAIISAGWDPGSDSVVRALMLAMSPKGITYTNFGPGMSMGHSVAVRSKAGVKDALSLTIPIGTGLHRRMVYVELLPGYKIEEVAQAIKTDPYFVHDETHVIEVEDVNALRDMGHGVNMTRKGVSGTTQNQLLEFNMHINNPALTAQILVASARAAMKQTPGCYTLIEIPVIDLLPGDPDSLIKALV